MVIRVIADIATFGPDLGRLCRVLGLSEAELEERGRGVCGSQNVEDGRGVLAGSVVEGQVYSAAALRRWLVALPESPLAGLW
jgi:hypothetical protein